MKKCLLRTLCIPSSHYPCLGIQLSNELNSHCLVLLPFHFHASKLQTTRRLISRKRLSKDSLTGCGHLTFRVIQLPFADLLDASHELGPGQAARDARPEEHGTGGEAEQSRPWSPRLLLLLRHQARPVHVDHVQRTCRRHRTKSFTLAMVCIFMSRSYGITKSTYSEMGVITLIEFCRRTPN